MRSAPEIGKQYDWDCPDVGRFRVTVVGHSPKFSESDSSKSLSNLCRVQYNDHMAWAVIEDLHEISDN